MESTASGTGGSPRKLAAASVGAAIAAAFASSLCCLGPLVLAALGLGGAGLLVGMEAYRPQLAVLTIVLLGVGFYLTYRRPRLVQVAVEGPSCDCPVPAASRLGRVALWVATLVIAAFLAFPYIAAIVFG
ncbi:MAG: mercury transporter MerT [Deltaproteobacteria bacterium]|nr:mercury transporter MerT [Deltaproteobacteria bacterium]